MSAFAGLQIAPPALVPTVRMLFQRQGINPNVIDADGTISSADAFAIFYDTVVLETSYTDPVVIKVDAPPDPRTRAILEQLRPRLTFKGRAGTFVMEPWGAPGVNQTPKIAVGAGAVVLGGIGAWLIYRAIF